MKKRIVFCLIIVLITTLLPGCNKSNGTMDFDAESGILILSGDGIINGLYDSEKEAEEPIEKEKIKKIVIEEGITHLQGCFNDMVSLESIVFPDSLDYISESFKGASSLSNLSVPLTIEEISDNSFSDSALSELTFRGPIHLKNGAFGGLTKLKFVRVPKDSVCEGAFRDCALEEVVIEKNVRLKETDGKKNFSQSSSDDFPKAYLYFPNDGAIHPWGEGGNYQGISIPEMDSWENYRTELMRYKEMPPESVKTDFDPATGTLTVTGTGDLEDLYPLSNERIDNRKIKKLVLSEGITGVYNCFNYLVALKEIELPSTLKIINDSFSEADALESLIVPKTVQKISGDSFCCCNRLKDLTFEGAIILDGKMGPFSVCDIEKLVIPANSFLRGAFVNCGNLKEIVIGPMTVVTPADLGDGDSINCFYSTLPAKPKIYICSPIHPAWDYSDVRCGKNGAYKPIIVPEGKSWEDYRNAPMELHEDKKD